MIKAIAIAIVISFIAFAEAADPRTLKWTVNDERESNPFGESRRILYAFIVDKGVKTMIAYHCPRQYVSRFLLSLDDLVLDRKGRKHVNKFVEKTFRVRIDQGIIHDITLRYRNEYTTKVVAIVKKEEGKLLKEAIMAGNKIVIEFPLESGSPYYGEYSLNGASNAMKEIDRKCKE